MYVGSLAGVTYLRYTVLMSSNKSETVIHCCDPALSVLVMLVSKRFSRSISLAVFCLLVTLRPPLHEIFAFLSNIRPRLARMRTSHFLLPILTIRRRCYRSRSVVVSSTPSSYLLIANCLLLGAICNRV